VCGDGKSIHVACARLSRPLTGRFDLGVDGVAPTHALAELARVVVPQLPVDSIRIYDCLWIGVGGLLIQCTDVGGVGKKRAHATKPGRYTQHEFPHHTNNPPHTTQNTDASSNINHSNTPTIQYYHHQRTNTHTHRSSPEIWATSSSERAKSKMLMFSARRSALVLLGMAAYPRWTAHL
jgi:hypothetical protein